MTQITTPLPFDQTILVSRRHRAIGTRLARAITRLRHNLRWTDRGDPLATPSRRALDTNDVRDMFR